MDLTLCSTFGKAGLIPLRDGNLDVLIRDQPFAPSPVRDRLAPQVAIAEGRFRVKIAGSLAEIESALRLRHEVFNVELAGETPSPDRSRLEFDELDLRCRHLIVIDQLTSRTVGTYRVNSIETGGIKGLYSHREFSIEDLPPAILRNGVEIGRACIAPEHRNTKVLFLLFKGLASYLASEGKRYFFGCCSIFTRDERVGAAAYAELVARGCVEKRLAVTPRKFPVDMRSPAGPVDLPNLFKMYLRIGARVCGPPMIDHDFGTIDFFVACDTQAIGEKYRRMFFDLK